MRHAAAFIAALLGLHSCVLPSSAAASQPEWAQVGQSLSPSKRQGHSAIWTGTRMIVWGGTAAGSFPPSSGGGPLADGGAYLPESDQWQPIAPSFLTPRSNHIAVWTGSQMIVWGGWDGSAPLRDGGIYDPQANTWTPLHADGPNWRSGMRGHWTGTEMLVWGAADEQGPAAGGAFDPASRTWRAIASADAPTAGVNSVWTGSDLLVWNPGEGWRYSVDSDSWSRITDVGEPVWRRGHAAVWTGEEMLVLGGGGSRFEPLPTFPGGAYSPATGQWRPIVGWVPDSSIVVWTGSHVVAFSGTSGLRSTTLSGGAVYDPSTDAWTSTPEYPGSPIGRTNSAAVWDGQSVIFFGGYNGDLFGRAGDTLDSMGRLFPNGLPAELRRIFADSFE